MDDITYCKFTSRNADNNPITHCFRFRCCQLLQAVQRIFCLDSLHSSQNRIHSNHDQDYNCAFRLTKKQGNHSRNNKDQHQKIFVLFQKDMKDTFFLSLRKLIGAKFLLPFLHFLICHKVHGSV